jgi:hypothetical protein
MRLMRKPLAICVLLSSFAIIVSGQNNRRVQAPQDLARQILTHLLRERLTPPNEQEQFIQRAESRTGGIASLFEAGAVDLNRDGRRELFVRLAPGDAVSELCSVVASCPSWIYRRAGRGYEMLWEGDSSARFLRTSTNGYRDIRTEEHATNAERAITIYKFDGTRYRTRICMTATYVGSRRGREILRYRRHRCDE